ncbi:hypothetical protein [Bacteroides nordii]|uniref:hypothetical protein n=1 Tax=Bacteroides nordii TaxID=291645 RepID=UPI002A82CCC8|nr:hypothetical protein [Bacteroides nordii]
MKKSIVIILFGILLVISFFSIKVSTNIYVGDYSYSPMVIDIQLKVDDKLVLDDSLHSSLYLPIILNEKLRYGIHKINVSSKKADIDQENRVFLFPNQHVYIEFFRADTLGMGEEALAEYNSIIETFPGVFSKRIPSRTRSSFGVWTNFNPFYTE